MCEALNGSIMSPASNRREDASRSCPRAGSERVYRARFPAFFGSDDQAHANDGTVEIWHIDTSKVKLSFATSDCPKEPR